MKEPYIIGLMLVVLAIPMILEKVPPNGLYGFRTRKTLSSPGVWYPANRKSGIYLALAGVVTLAAYAAYVRLYGEPTSAAPILIILTLPLLVAVAASFAYLRKL